MIALVVFTDGRDDVLAETIDVADVNLRGSITDRVIVDDTGDADHAKLLRHQYGDRYRVVAWTNRRGFTGSIRHAWQALALQADNVVEFVFHLEDDFLIREPINLDHLGLVLQAYPHLAQMSLLRQAWNDEEKAAGGIIQCAPDDYTERWAVAGIAGREDTFLWMEQRRFFTTNPSLYRRELCAVGWPDLEHSEGHFTHQLLREGLPWGIAPDAVRFGIWGKKDDEPRVLHIGEHRVGTGY